MAGIEANKLKSILIAAVSTFVLTALRGCGSTGIAILDKDSNVDWSKLYLRGVFTWWEAEESFRFKQVSTNLYVATANLVADGQPYDFKIADKDWTPGMSCGYLNKEQDEVITLGTESKADCDTPVNNFRFTPESSGEYLFYFKAQGNQPPSIFVEKGES